MGGGGDEDGQTEVWRFWWFLWLILRSAGLADLREPSVRLLWIYTKKRKKEPTRPEREREREGCSKSSFHGDKSNRLMGVEMENTGMGGRKMRKMRRMRRREEAIQSSTEDCLKDRFSSSSLVTFSVLIRATETELTRRVDT